jgi:hypothetical protein
MMLEERGQPYLLGIRGNDTLWSELDPTSALCALPAAERRGNAGFLARGSKMWC